MAAPVRLPVPATAPRSAARTFGEVSKLPSGRFRARYTGPDGVRYSADRTFDSSRHADKYLAKIRAEISRDEWRSPRLAKEAGIMLLGDYAERTFKLKALKPRTLGHYRSLLAGHLKPLALMPLGSITADVVELWFAAMTDAEVGPTIKAHSYGLLNTVMRQAVASGVITKNPCTIPGAGKAERVHEVIPPTIGEIDKMAAALSPKFAIIVQIAAWCGLRQGEIFALRRQSIVFDNSGAMKIIVRRGIVRVKQDKDPITGRVGKLLEATPKSKAGTRELQVPGFLAAEIIDYLAEKVGPAPETLLFPSETGDEFMSSYTLYRHFWPARAKAGREDLHFHDLRHFAASAAGEVGPFVATMQRLGHSSPETALLYAHPNRESDRRIAEGLNEMRASHDAASAVVAPRAAGEDRIQEFVSKLSTQEREAFVRAILQQL